MAKERGNVRVTVEFRWRRLGQVRRDLDGGLLFPSTGYIPGVYRFRLWATDRSGITSVKPANCAPSLPRSPRTNEVGANEEIRGIALLDSGSVGWWLHPARTLDRLRLGGRFRHGWVTNKRTG